MNRSLFLALLATSALTQATSFAGVTVVGNLARQIKVQPGQAFDGVVLLKNTDSHPAEARIYQTDYSSRADGTSDYAEPGTSPRSNANWITLSPSRVKLAPGETVPVRFKGTAPKKADLRGSYWSMLMVEPNASAAASPETGKVSVGLQTLIRFGVQIVTEVGTQGTRSLQILDKSMAKADGKRMLQVDLANNGERLLIPNVALELFDRAGASIGRFDGGRTRIYPASSVRARVDLTDVPPGQYTAMLLLDSGDEQVMAAQYDLEVAP